DDDAAGLHLLDEVLGDEFGGASAGDEDGADDEVGAADGFLDIVRVRVERLDAAAEDVLEVDEGVGLDVEDGDLGAHADGDGRGVLADDAAADDDDAAATRSGHAAEEETLAALLFLEAARADLGGHAAGDLAHRAK